MTIETKTGWERYWDSFRALGMRGSREESHLKNHLVMTRNVNMDDGAHYFVNKNNGRVRSGHTLSGSFASASEGYYNVNSAKGRAAPQSLKEYQIWL